MGRIKVKPTVRMTDAQVVNESRPKLKGYQGTEGKKYPRPCILCGVQVSGTLGDLEHHQATHVDTQYDYDNQAWIVNGLYARCYHSASMGCECYGRLHEGEKAPSIH
ncbi:MAG: hypothetical protein COC11_03660 [Candidatus Neomarinimicrobiota bacterium]|nr:MAG: hypothetical protein COC11_03660 [Candidatus Neomarinimicrobiota bacterium]